MRTHEDVGFRQGDSSRLQPSRASPLPPSDANAVTTGEDLIRDLPSRKLVARRIAREQQILSRRANVE